MSASKNSGEPEEKWVQCPICGESDMEREVDRDGDALIHCINNACGSNGRDNFSAVKIENLPPIELRDQFAMAALTGNLAAWAGASKNMPHQSEFAKGAYAVADAMLAEREKGKA